MLVGSQCFRLAGRAGSDICAIHLTWPALLSTRSLLPAWIVSTHLDGSLMSMKAASLEDVDLSEITPQTDPIIGN